MAELLSDEKINEIIQRVISTPPKPISPEEVELDEITYGMMTILEATGDWHLEEFCAANPKRAAELREFARDYEDLQVRLLFVEAD